MEQQRALENLRATHAEMVTQLANAKMELADRAFADGAKRALFLPSVWGQLSDPTVFVSRLKQKAGLASNHWSNSFRAWRFVTESVSIDDLQ